MEDGKLADGKRIKTFYVINELTHKEQIAVQALDSSGSGCLAAPDCC